MMASSFYQTFKIVHPSIHPFSHSSIAIEWSVPVNNKIWMKFKLLKYYRKKKLKNKKIPSLTNYKLCNYIKSGNTGHCPPKEKMGLWVRSLGFR
jgi:hypothetical protein